MERIQKIIANSGYCSRRKAEELIEKGHVKVDGIVVNQLGTKITGNEQIEIDGEIIGNDEKVYILLNKPRGVVTTVSDDKHRKTVIDVLELDKRVYPVGRLDYDTTGVLLLTNDGEFANLLMHPKHEVDKVYIAKVEGIVSGTEIHQLENGILIEGKKTARAKAKLRKVDRKTNTSLVELTIHEGRNHQVKKMFEATGHEVIRLKRERYAFLTTDGLKSGEFRFLNPKEVKKLYFEIDQKQEKKTR